MKPSVVLEPEVRCVCCFLSSLSNRYLGINTVPGFPIYLSGGGGASESGVGWKFLVLRYATPSSKSLMYKKEKKASSSPITWHRYAKRTIRWLWSPSSRCKEVRGKPQRNRGRTLGTMCTCEEIERGTHDCRASKLGPVERWWTQDGKLGITIQEPPPRVRKTDTFIVFYLFVLHSVTCLTRKTCHFTACFTSLWTSISVFYDSVSEGLPSSEYGRGVLLSTLHYDSEACVKRHW